MLGGLQREGFETLAVFLQAVHPLVEKRGVRQALVENVAADGRQPDEIRAGVRAQKEIGAARHLMLAQIGDDQLLAAQLVGALDARREHRMALRRVAADDENKVGLLDVGDRTGIAAVADRAEEARRGRRLAVARAVVDVVGADDGARQLLHQVAFLVRALGGGDERERVGPVRGLDLREAAGDQVEAPRPNSPRETCRPRESAAWSGDRGC